MTGAIPTAAGDGCGIWSSKVWRKESVSHFPRGTSEWNEIEHRMYCQVTENWRARPPVSREVVPSQIGAVTATRGWTIRSELDEKGCDTGRKVKDDQRRSLSIQRVAFHGEWNCSPKPRS